MPLVVSFGLIKVDSWGGLHVQCLSWLRFKHLYTNIVMGKQYFPSLIYAFNKTLCMAFVHLEKSFHHVPWHVIWWALHKLGIEEWLVLLIQSLYENARSRVCFGCNLSEVLSVKVGVLQGFCLNLPTVSSQVCHYKMLCGMGQIKWAPVHLQCSPPAHFPSPPNEEIAIHASGAPGPCNRKLGPTLFDFHCLQCNDWGMICLVYSVTTKDQVSSQDLLERMQLDNQAKVLHRLKCHGYVEPSDGWLKEVMAIALGLRPIPLTVKLGVVDLEVLSDWTYPNTRD